MARTDETGPAQAPDETDADRLRRAIAPGELTMDLVYALAGDRQMTDAEVAVVREQRARRGNVFFSDLLYVISHHYFAPEIAEDLWTKVLSHKKTVSKRLGRNVRIAVATLDYLSNVTSEIGELTLISEAYVSEIAKLCMRDGMTGLFNHTSCYELLELELRAHRRYGVGVSLLLLDIDDFKTVNDHSGHLEGDRVLAELAAVLVEQSRESDVCCRLGGDEFAVILRLTSDADEALDVAERIRTQSARVRSAGRSVTVSIGVAMCDAETESSRDLMARADRALYEAKIAGKNRVSCGAPVRQSTGGS